MYRFFLYAILLWLAYFLVKRVGKALFSPPEQENGQSDAPAETELIRDPECGAYFLQQKGVKGVVDGRVINFCSEQCYEKYLKSREIKQ